MTTYDPTSRTPAEWRAMAAENARRSSESWERSDTDGFLSQWANDTMSALYHACAELAENGGMADFVVLADADGNVIEEARQVETRYGWRWVYDTSDGQTVWFSESHHSNPAIAAKRNAAKGHSIMTVQRPALVKLSGGYTPHPVYVRKRAR